MTTEIAAIKNFTLSFGVSSPPFNGTPTTNQILQRLQFSAVNNILIKEGSYTPNNDYIYMWNNIPAAAAPNFIFIQTPTQLNITVTAPGGKTICAAVPVDKVFMLCLPPGFIIDNVYIEGRDNAPLPMALGVETQYYCLMAQATF